MRARAAWTTFSRVDRRFICTTCGTKWFIAADAEAAPDLTECGSCGGPLAWLGDGLRGDEAYGSLPGERRIEGGPAPP